MRRLIATETVAASDSDTRKVVPRGVRFRAATGPRRSTRNVRRDIDALVIAGAALSDTGAGGGRDGGAGRHGGSGAPGSPNLWTWSPASVT